jgi:5-methylthioadenosine/S-adenosylhomocysteine deaminase
MKRTLINDVDVVTLDAAGQVITGCSVALEGGIVRAVGEPPVDFQPDEVVQGKGKVAVPAMFNAHCHAAMTFERGWAEDLPFPRWLNEKIWVAESALRPDDVYWGAALAVCEMIRGGVAAFHDHYFHMDEVARVVQESGVKGCLAWCVFGIGQDKELGAGLQGALQFVDRCHGAAQGRLRAALGPHSPYVCPPEFLREVASLARDKQVPIHLHVAESDEQVANSRQRHGKTPVEHLEALGIFDVPCTAAHCLSVSDADLDILANKGVTAAHTPITYMKLAMGVNDLGRFDAHGVKVALGTDGPASNADLDMFAAMRLAVLLQKHHRRDPAALPGDTALRMATRHGALAMGFDNSGSLEVGRAADLMLVDFARPHLVPCHDPVANLVHAAKSSDVTDLWVDGRRLLENGTILTLDEERIRAMAARGARELVGRGMQRVRTYQA